ncbi:MAG: hypothetical protein NZ455_06365 [Bacteroidia bacterium]|nr:hypothetical protein [Bacteroidia bacterium]MDW8346254.1 hypothetical protein [Bacteroidia bacterium]
MPRGWAGGGVAPTARSTPTRAQRGTRPKYKFITNKHTFYIF